MKITKTKLLNGQEISFGDFNVFIGGNGVGKTTFISELFHRATQIDRTRYYWVDTPEYEVNNLASDVALLKTSFSKKWENNSWFYFSQATKDVAGNTDLGNNIRFSPTEIESIDSISETTLLTDVRYRRPFIAFSSCDARLGLPDEAGLTPYNQPAQDAINVLQRNKQLFHDIDSSIYDRFGSHFILLSHMGTTLQLGLSPQELPPAPANPGVQEEYERVEGWKIDNFTRLTEAGHGIRSMARLLTSLLDPVNQIIVIDEPEMHLYPSAKRWLGKKLVLLAKEQNKQVFLVTHDPMILQGILDASLTTNIFRVERTGSNGSIKTCALDRVEDANAMRNQEQYLQGLFYQRCIVVEGASDRSFYQNMIDDFPEIQDKDLGFVAAGGKGNTKHIADIASKVGLSIAFIYDFDVILFNQDLLIDVFVLMGGNKDVLTELNTAFEKEDTSLRTTQDEKERNKKIREICKYSEKKGVTSTWATTNNSLFDNVRKNLASKGIFIVPKGTLESWAPDVEPKVRFAELAPEVVRANTALRKDFDEFAKKVLAYLGIA